jgi:FkbM family methyltransferase
MAWEAFWKRYRAGLWEADTRQLIRDLIEPGDLFVDIGAWIGPCSLWAQERGAEVIAIEPDPVALRELRRQVPHAEIWPGAVIATGDRPLLAANPRGRFGDSMSRISKHGERCQGWTLPHILSGKRPRLVIMDVEGYEARLLPTVAPDLAARGSALQVELHDEMPRAEWFAGFSEVTIPEAPRDRNGRPMRLVALP